jgi:soluble lytic murein transglycosylase-like protein
MRPLALLSLFSGLASAGEYALLANGGRLPVERHERAGSIVRLYVAGGSIEIDAAEVRGFEAEEQDPRPSGAPAVPTTGPAVPQLAPPASASAPKPVTPGDLAPEKLANAAAAKYGLPPSLVRSVMKAESGFQPRAVSPKGAVGLMQLMPGTAQGLGVNPFDPVQNVDAGTRYLRELLEKYHGLLRHALAAYNAGPEAVEKHGGVPPFAETLDYIRRVEREWKRAD